MNASSRGRSGTLSRSHSQGGMAASCVEAAEAWDAESQTVVLKMALKCADLGHLTSSKDVHMRWVKRLEEEMFRQGDAERALGLSISPLMDRSKGGITKAQSGFFNVVALPMYSSFAQVFPPAVALLDNVKSNLSMWTDLEARAKTE